jgi:hypothetical protein
MGRRRKPPEGARALNGWVVVDKPAGMTSAAVVSTLRRALRPMRIGHAGTLDPLATGVLPVALGEATKTVAYIVDGRKPGAPGHGRHPGSAAPIRRARPPAPAGVQRGQGGGAPGLRPGTRGSGPGTCGKINRNQ